MLFALLLAPVLVADEKTKPVRLPIAASDLPVQQVDWYGIYMQGHKNGHARIAMKKVANGFQLDMRMYFKIKSMGQTTEIDIREIQLFDDKPPYALREIKAVHKQGKFSTTYVVKRVGDKYQAVITSGKVVRNRTVALDFTLADLLTPMIWIRRKPKVGDRLTVRSLDTSELKIDSETYQVLKVKKVRVQSVPVIYYELKVVMKEGAFMARIDQRGTMISMKIGGFLELRLESEKLAKNLEQSVDLFVEMLLKLDKPLGGESPRVRSLVLEISGKGAAKVQDGPHQRVVTENGKRLLKLGRAHGVPLKATEKTIADGLKDTVQYPVKHQTVKALLAKVLKGNETPRQKIHRLIAFVDKYIEDSYGANPQTVFDIIRIKKGDCTEHAVLFVTLARAAGIPAREVSGLMYMGDEIVAFGAHAWCEVVLDGHWVPVDPTWGQTLADATHITLDRGDGLQGLEILGQLKVKLVSVKLAPKRAKKDQ